MEKINKKLIFILLFLPVLAVWLVNLDFGNSTEAAEVCCYHECDPSDANRCDGNTIQYCGDCDSDTYSDWCDLLTCGADEVCVNGGCSAINSDCTFTCGTGPGCRTSFLNAEIDPGGECCGLGWCFTCRGGYHWDAVSGNCLQDCIDADNDGYGAAGSVNCLYPEVDCNDNSEFVYPGRTEVCDNMDNDCDGDTDESCDNDFDGYCDGDMQYYNYPVLVCLKSKLANGAFGDDCDDADFNFNPGEDEICDGINDENCNGIIDDGCLCVNGEAESCGIDTGICVSGDRYCDLGAWGDCIGEVSPEDEVCDGLDNNCNGPADEVCNQDGDDYCSCNRVYVFGSDLSAVCPGTDTANAATVAATCDCDDTNSGIHPGFTEICNGDGIDNNCDGNIDEGCVCTNGQTQVCGTSDVGECQKGIQTCVAGAWGACVGNIEPAVEVCGDGLDNDCNGTPDDGCGIPTSFDWRDYAGKNWMTEVQDQGSCGGCWAFATMGVAEAKYNIQTGAVDEVGDPDVDLSEQYQISECVPPVGAQPYSCQGGWHGFDFDTVDEDCYEYITTQVQTSLSTCEASWASGNYVATPGRCSDWNDKLWNMADNTRIPFSFSLYSITADGRGDDVKQLIMDKGPLWSAMGDATTLTFTGEGTWRCTDDDSSSDLNHAVVIVGWNDAQGYWIVRNSWGTSHADGGYDYIEYGECFLGAYYYLESVVAPLPPLPPTPPLPPLPPG